MPDTAQDKLRTLLQSAPGCVPAEDMELVLAEVDVLLKNKLVTASILRSATVQHLVAGGISLGAAIALKTKFPELPAAGVAGAGVSAATVAGAGVAVNDTTSVIMRELLGEPLAEPPLVAELGTFLESALARKLVCMDADYTAAVAQEPLAGEMLTYLSAEPTAQSLAFVVSGVLKGTLRDVPGEDMLHGDVDHLFLWMLRLAANAGLLEFQYARDTIDKISDSTEARRRPDFMLWIKQALLLKGEEKRSAAELAQAVREILAKMSIAWIGTAHGPRMYMFAYVVAGPILEIYAVQGDALKLLLHANMSSLMGKLTALRAVVNMTRVLRALARHVPDITWGVGQAIERTPGGTLISRITNYGTYVNKELFLFSSHHSRYTTLELLKSLYSAVAVAAQQGRADNLVHPKEPVRVTRTRVIITTVPVGTACSNPNMLDKEDIKPAIRGAVAGCGQLHALGFVHRDVRWPNIIKVYTGHFKVIDLEYAGQLGAVCVGEPYPLPRWKCASGTVLEPDGAYSARSDLKMIGKMLEGLEGLDDEGLDLQRKLQSGEFTDAAAVLQHAWFQ